VPQITAIAEGRARLPAMQASRLIADGGIQVFPGTSARRLPPAAQLVMIGSLFAGTEEILRNHSL